MLPQTEFKGRGVGRSHVGVKSAESGEPINRLVKSRVVAIRNSIYESSICRKD